MVLPDGRVKARCTIGREALGPRCYLHGNLPYRPPADTGSEGNSLKRAPQNGRTLMDR